MKMLKTFLLSVLLTISSVLIGCNDAGLNSSSQEESSSKAVPDSKVMNIEPAPPKLIKETDEVKFYQLHYKFQEEQWNDPEILSTTRLQFAWVKPGDKENETSLWSMRLDGSDLRQVASKELLETPTIGAIDSRFPIVRSPNNRYVAFAVKTCFSCSERRILDLETKEVIVAPMGGNEPDF